MVAIVVESAWENRVRSWGARWRHVQRWALSVLGMISNVGGEGDVDKTNIPLPCKRSEEQLIQYDRICVESGTTHLKCSWRRRQARSAWCEVKEW